MLYIKVIYFIIYGGNGSILPYFPIFYYQSGMSTAFIGIVGAVVPAMSFFMSPIWGVIADSFRVHREVMACTSALAVFCCMSQLVAVRLQPGNSMLLAGVVVVYAFFNCGWNPIIESGVLASLPSPEDYGRHRLWGAVGFGITSLLSGVIIAVPAIGFRGAFGTYACLVMLGIFLVLYRLPLGRPKQAGLPLSSLSSKPTLPEDPASVNNVENQQSEVLDEEAVASNGCEPRPPSPSPAPAHPSPSLRSALGIIISTPEAALFFLVVFILGCCSGVIDRFLFVFIEDLGGSETIMGISRAITCFAEVPFFHYSKPLIRRLGVHGVLILTCVCYAVRLLYYSFLTSPWLVLPAETLHGITYAAMWAASVLQARALAPPGMEATAQGLLSGVHWGLGISVGSFAGGYLYANLGPVVTFRLTAGAACFCMMLIFFYRMFWGSETKNTLLEPLVTQQDSKGVYNLLEDGDNSANGEYGEIFEDVLDIPPGVSRSSEEFALMGVQLDNVELLASLRSSSSFTHSTPS